MNKFKENWKDYNPPTIPIYFIDLEALKHMVARNPEGISIEALYMMLGYFEEYELYEKAAVVDKVIKARGHVTEAKVVPLTKTPEFLPPDDGNVWIPSADGTYWQTLVSKEDLMKYLKNGGKLSDDDLEPA